APFREVRRATLPIRSGVADHPVPREDRGPGSRRLAACTPASGSAAEDSDRPFARQEEIAAASHGHEARQASEAQRAVRRGGSEDSGRAGATRKRINLVLEPVKARSQHIRLLHELELALDVRVDAHEEQSRVARSVVRDIVAADAEDAVPVLDTELLARPGLEG